MPAPSKRDKQSSRKYEQNKPIRTHLRNLSRNFYKAVEAGDTERAASSGTRPRRTTTRPPRRASSTATRLLARPAASTRRSPVAGARANLCNFRRVFRLNARSH